MARAAPIRSDPANKSAGQELEKQLSLKMNQRPKECHLGMESGEEKITIILKCEVPQKKMNAQIILFC